ncbi:MAG: aldo/keto reductase [Methanomassiliicoccales archaeon]
MFTWKEGFDVPEIGLGTWKLGGTFTPDTENDKRDVAAIRTALEIGYRFIDTAEMYGAGHCEELVRQAVDGSEGVTIATKVWQTNLAYEDVLKSAQRSLKRLGVKTIDLYQIHWPNDSIPIRETMRAMEKLKEEGKIAHIGVSNFGVELLEDARSCLSKYEIVSNQIKFNLLDKAAEHDLLAYCKKEGIGIIAYEPLARGRVFTGRCGKVLNEIAARNGKTPSQVALNWIICSGAMPIPKSSDAVHLKENLGATDWRLYASDLKVLNDI